MKYLSTLLIIIFIAACSTSEKAVQDAMDEIKENYPSGENIDISSLGIDLQKYRSKLSDTYTARENKIPEAFNRIRVEQKVEKDLYEGYRVQIYSGQNVADADTIAANFEAWSDTTIVGYQPETYVFFRTPYYRVHVGDFHERERAIEFSNIVKRYYRDAWVVYDKVNPFRVPADTVIIESE